MIFQLRNLFRRIWDVDCILINKRFSFVACQLVISWWQDEEIHSQNIYRPLGKGLFGWVSISSGQIHQKMFLSHKYGILNFAKKFRKFRKIFVGSDWDKKFQNHSLSLVTVVSIVITVYHLCKFYTFYNLDEVKIDVLITFWSDVNFLPPNVTTSVWRTFGMFGILAFQERSTFRNIFYEIFCCL